MILLGLVLFILGVFLPIPVLETVGIVLMVIGAVLFVAGTVGHPVLGRRHYW